MSAQPQQPFAEALKRRHDFDAWCGRSKLPGNLFIRGLFVAGDELRGWQPRRVRHIRAPGWPPSVRAIWTDRLSASAVQVATFECTSRDAAHEFLIRTLAEAQSPLVGMRDDLEIGDVTFGAPRANALAYARANVVVVVRHIAGRAQAVVDPATDFDARLVAVHAGAEGGAQPAVTPARTDPRTLRLSIPDAPSPAADSQATRAPPPAMYKLWSESGDFCCEDDASVVYRAARAGEQQVVGVCELRPGAAPVAAALRFLT